MHDDFSNSFRALTGHAPFPWQRELYARFVSERGDNIPSSCSLPIWLDRPWSKLSDEFSYILGEDDAKHA